jgi:putative hydrolase of the HAD superfamily
MTADRRPERARQANSTRTGRQNSSMATPRLDGIRVVVFDLDDTLHSERLYAFSGFRAVARWLSHRMACPADPALRMRELFDGGYRGRVFDQLLIEWGCDRSQEWVPEMVAVYRSHQPTIHLYKDAEAVIRQWSETFQLSLISDGLLEMQQRKVQALNLGDRLEPVILTDAWGREYWKPHRRGFQELERSSGSSGRQCVYIADNPEKDFLAPRALGWRTILIRRADGIYREAQAPDGGQAECEVHSLLEITISS